MSYAELDYTKEHFSDNDYYALFYIERELFNNFEELRVSRLLAYTFFRRAGLHSKHFFLTNFEHEMSIPIGIVKTIRNVPL